MSFGKQIGRIKSVIGTRSFKRSKAISLSKFVKLNCCAIARSTKRVSGRTESLHRSCSPKVTLIMNHIKLKIQKYKIFKLNTYKICMTFETSFKKKFKNINKKFWFSFLILCCFFFFNNLNIHDLFLLYKLIINI